MPLRSSPTAVPKRPSKVSISSDPLGAPRAAAVDLPTVLERAPAEKPAANKDKRWRDENFAAIQVYNEHVEKRGTFSDGERTF